MPEHTTPTQNLHQSLLENLALRFPTIDSALAEIAALEAHLTLPKGSIHIISDIHGEHAKLRHVINNASGALRPLVSETFSTTLTSEEQENLISILYYPAEYFDEIHDKLADTPWRRHWIRQILRHQATLIRKLACSYRHRDILERIDTHWREFFTELLDEPISGRPPEYLNTAIDVLIRHERDLAAIRHASRLIRNLTAEEIIVGGDLGDRGPRMDRVTEYLMQQPAVSITWGNHDISWMGACLGSEPLIANLLRISLRYRRLFQLEEGYGLLLLPLEQLAQTIYGEDPAECFYSKGTGLRDPLTVARMQKAIFIIQAKLESQILLRHPEWNLQHRCLLHRINPENGTITIDGKTYPLRDTHLPTIDWSDPYQLSPEENDCITRLRQSFIESSTLWKHMQWLVRNGAMSLVRDQTVTFHGCLPVDDTGAFLHLYIDGKEVAGKEMFTAFEQIIRRSFRKGAARASQPDLDWLWYLWSGPKSPLFGKDRITTFENYFIEDKQTHTEHKNPYFQLIHDHDFCCNVASEIGGNPDALIVNGHVPVKLEKGEHPVKKGGNAVTIDGAFSEAYGDRGYTLVLDPDRIYLAEHHHFESIADALHRGIDIIPKITTLRSHQTPRTVAHTEQGSRIQSQITNLEALIHAYQNGTIR